VTGFTGNFGQAKATLALLRARIAYPQPVLALIGQHAKLRAEFEIRSGKHDPDGKAWAPWADGTSRSRQRKGNLAQGLLWDEGTLLHSISVQVGAVDVLIGTDAGQYAEYLQDGTYKMPARRFLGWGPEGEKEAEKTMIDYLEAGL
jgi:phage gpG-like protein